MVEGDLVDLTLPSLLQVMSRECSTAILRLQRGTDQGAMYFAEGVLVLNTDIAINELCQSAAVGAPIVLSLWEHPEQLPALPCVAVDFAHAGALAARHLLELGHRDIGMLVGDGCGGLQDARATGFREVMREAGLEPDDAAVLQIPDTIDAGL